MYVKSSGYSPHIITETPVTIIIENVQVKEEIFYHYFIHSVNKYCSVCQALGLGQLLSPGTVYKCWHLARTCRYRGPGLLGHSS